MRRTRARVCLLAVALTLLTTACDYSILGGDASRSNSNGFEPGLSVGNVGGLHEKPGFPVSIAGITGHVGALQTPPVVADGKIFVNGIDGYLHALNGDGSEAWRAATGAPLAPAPPTVDGFHSVIAVAGNHIFAFNDANGAPYSTVDLGGTPYGRSASPVEYQMPDAYYTTVGGGGGAVANPYHGHQMSITGNLSTAVAAADHTVYVGGDDGHVHALNPSTGAAVWDYTCSGCAPVLSVTVAGDKLIVARDSGRLFALNRATGSKVWDATNSDGTEGKSTTPAAVANGAVYVGTKDGSLKSYGVSDGRQIASAANVSPTGITVANGVVYTANPLRAYDASSLKQLWKPSFAGNGNPVDVPVVANGAVYEFDSNGALHAFVP